MQWNGLCFNGQDAGGQWKNGGYAGRLSHEECKNRCNKDHGCSAFASHPGKFCLITSGGQQVSQWTKTTRMKYTCYAKITGMSYNYFWF